MLISVFHSSILLFLSNLLVASAISTHLLINVGFTGFDDESVSNRHLPTELLHVDFSGFDDESLLLQLPYSVS